ncbi:pyrroloquinoline quinone precursor peptide PqqA [Jiella flava]|uniref:Coenzyme PQQ synthesis protein A n=1 Tax=Jiella flava TaxID=2816857 RepID=A0A939G2U5_9HYPH|nr:pyrroloquinoline quinone precursor peptide PqqA [Jiella flava]MBO0664202.1 pyrroloquinoline quinone precursor peptide PqqA [Jiella flava]
MAAKQANDKQIGRETMAWNKPIVTEICMAMEINGYMPVEF